ncbi:MAG: hypothetical protein CMK09_12715 [Ponticaulis sp.]|nr:hypothetical protein [Ponticaulis sp.]|tara:strand:- start:16597 stop:17700 length:1104 start_codon:yes stop_codon:yes gene_type:complete
MALIDTDGHAQSTGFQSTLSGWLTPLFDKKKSILGPIWDAVLFYLTPLWCVLGLWALSDTSLWYTNAWFNYEHGVLSFLAGVLTTAHLLAVVFRSHVNQTVFRQWPIRFTVVPALVFIALASSMWLLVIVTVIAVVWDVYHGAMQNFGLSRIYDSRLGNDAKAGRLLDSMMNLVLYAGPIGAGVTLGFHLDNLHSFEDLGFYALSSVPSEIIAHAGLVRWITIIICAVCVAIYFIGYWRLSRQGYKVSPQKVLLMASTAVASVIAWGFNPAAIAFAAMNLFHAIQYFGILYAREGKSLSATFRVDRLPSVLRPWLICAILFLPTLAYGVWEFFASPDWDMVFALIVTVTIMHYWYDGFIWSVRKKQV